MIQSEFHTIVFTHDDDKILIATTRPEFLPGCVAVLVNPEDERYSHLAGKTIKTPLYNKNVPVLTDENVKIDKGTGVVMCCTFGDSIDMEWVEKFELPIISVVTPEGRIESDIEYIGGLTVKEARKTIIELLNEHSLLTESKSIEHSVSLHDRCSIPSEIVSSAQWYISALKHKDALLEYGGKINWYPEFMKKKYDIWVQNLKWDWCVSRQRFFGVPIPVWYCKDCNKVVVANQDQLPVDPTMIKPPIVQCSCGCTEFIPETAVLDTWATSSVTPKIDELLARKVGYKGKFLPCSMRTHAHEIIRTWSFYTVLRSYLHDRNIPWNDLMICGFVLAKKGEKLSKSKNNSIYEPKSLLQNYPADIIRFCAASTKLGTDTYFTENELSEASRTLTKLWNVFKYVIMQLEGYIPSKPKTLLPIDKWIIEKAKNAMHEAKQQLDKYEAGLAKQIITTFFWSDFCDNYVEISKARIYNTDIYGEDKSNSGKYALYTSFLYIQKMLAIYMPHITEYIYQKLYKNFQNQTSLHRTQWDNNYEPNTVAVHSGQVVVDIIFEARKFKSKNNLSLRVPIKNLNITVVKSVYDDVMLTIDDIKVTTAANVVNIQSGDTLSVHLQL